MSKHIQVVPCEAPMLLGEIKSECRGGPFIWLYEGEPQVGFNTEYGDDGHTYNEAGEILTLEDSVMVWPAEYKWDEI